jgi:FAD/FMN-containing dehydrogenase
MGFAVAVFQLLRTQVRLKLYGLWHNEPLYRHTWYYPSPLRVGGSFHSLNACFVSEGTQILLRHFDRIQVDTDEMTVTVGAAVKMFQIRDALKPHGMQTAVTPEISNATAGSVACCGTKDASLGRSGSGQVSSTAIGVRLVNAKGEVETITEARDQDRMRCPFQLRSVRRHLRDHVSYPEAVNSFL